ncbi:MAG: hypothetical protein KBA31_22345 [Alphaproteobacteria bacterium]|nr:hypothetical protein [Alphaproteobacteria bacterium]
MRTIFAGALITAFTALAAMAATSSEPKKPTPVNIKAEIVSKCGTIPYGPTLVMDAKTATKEEMENAKQDVVAFITQSDAYQDCLVRLANSLGPRLSDNDKRLIAAAIERSQQEKEALGNDYNKLVDNYNKLHK